MIRSIHIKNYKSIIETSTDLPKFGALVGLNAAGKSNIIQTLILLGELSRNNSLSVFSDRFSFFSTGLFNINSDENSFTVKIEFESPTEQVFEYRLKIGLENPSEASSDLVISSEHLTQLEPENKNIFSRENNSLKDGNEKLVPLTLEKNKSAIASYQQPETATARKMLSSLIVDDLSVLSQRKTIVQATSRGLGGLLVRLKKRSPEGYENFLKVIPKITTLTPEIVDLPVSPTDKEQKQSDQYYAVTFEEQNLKGRLSIEAVSAGDLRTLFVLGNAFLAQRGTTVIIEEIENGIHPKRLSELVERLRSIAEVRKIQVIFSTHSPSIINKLVSDEVLLVHKGKDKKTDIIRLSQGEHLAKVNSFLQKGGDMSDVVNFLH